MNLSSCLEVLQGNLLNSPEAINQKISSIEIDSRKVKTGSLFVAIKGTKSNGEDFIPQAEQNGCVAVVAENSVDFKGSSIQVKDTYLAAAQLAEYQYESPAESMDLIGVTGTNGKTSVSMMIHWLLEKSGRKAGLSGTVFISYGNVQESSEMTTPDALSFQKMLFEMKQHGVETVCLEVSSHALSQHRVGTYPFKTAIFTNLTQDHLDYHDDMDDYFSAKARLFTELLGEKGKAVINVDDEYGKRLARSIAADRLISVGLCGSVDYKIKNIESTFNGIKFEIEKEGKIFSVKSPLIGRFNAFNLVQVIAALELEGIPLSESVKLLEGFPGVPGRMQVFVRENKMVVVDYAHTPDALEKALTALKPLTSKLHCIFGCGGDRDNSKRSLMGEVASKYVDQLWLTDDNPRTEASEKIIEDILSGIAESSHVNIEQDREACIQKAVLGLDEGEILLVAGKGHEDYQIYGSEKKAFCDRAVVSKYLEELA